MRCIVIGLGEAGAVYAAALLEQGHQVIGVDPADNPTPAGVDRADDIASALSQPPDVVLVLTGAAASPAVAQQCIPHLRSGTHYVDCTSSSPQMMRELATLVERTGATFTDVAILGPVPVSGARTPLIISGSGREHARSLLAQLGAPVEVLDAPAGAAMGHKLLRSVVMKGLAAVVVEAVEAGRAAGSEQWIRDQIANQLAGDGHAVIDRFLTGTQNHAARRAHEMADTAAYLTDLGVPAEMTYGAHRALSRVAASTAQASAPAAS